MKGKDREISSLRAQLAQITTDFRYNLKLLEGRDAELERYEAAVQSLKDAAERRENSLVEGRARTTEVETSLKRERARREEVRLAC